MLRDTEVQRWVWLPIALDAPGGAVPEAAHDTEMLWTEFHDRMRSFVSRRVQNETDAEDIVQKVFLRIHRTLARLRDRDRLDAWLYQTARNAIVDHYRSPARRREVPAGDTLDMELLQVERPAEPPDTSELARAAACLRPMIDRLPDLYRRAITLAELEGRSQAEAARIEGLSVSGMKARVQRGRARLRDMLLECCQVALDRRRRVLGCETRGAGSASCSPSANCE